MAALQEIDAIIDNFDPMDKDSICSDQQISDDLDLASDDGINTNNDSNDTEHEQKTEFDVNSLEYMPCEKNMLYDFTKWMNLEFVTDKTSIKSRTDLHLKLLNAHPFVKAAGDKTVYDYPNHRFTIQKYILNCRAFNVWCRKNKEW
eukprot:373328_1